MKDFVLNFKFKGDRNYIHGSDIYTKIAEYLNAEGFKISKIDLSFHKIAHNNLKGEIFPADHVSSPAANPVSIYKFVHNLNESYVIHLFETDTEVKESYTYDEENIVDAASMNMVDKSISLASITPSSTISYSNIEKVITLNKALLTKLLTDPGKWYFTRITMDKDINTQHSGTIRLKLVKNIGSKITKTLILFDENEQGYIYFSKV